MLSCTTVITCTYMYIYTMFIWWFKPLPPLKVLGMLLRGKSRLINGNILHLTFTLVGTVDSEHESACIPNPIAFRDLLAGTYMYIHTCIHLYIVFTCTMYMYMYMCVYMYSTCICTCYMPYICIYVHHMCTLGGMNDVDLVLWDLPNLWNVI